MKLEYDPKHNVAYLYLQKRRGTKVQTISVSDELNIDLAPDGTVYGIELLNANQQLGSNIIIDAGHGRPTEIPVHAA